MTSLDTPCREWQGARTNGYGRIHREGRMWLVQAREGRLVITKCYVCEGILDTEVAHTYHGEGCPLRTVDPHDDLTAEACLDSEGCGGDVHEECCPTCTGQAF
jgi:hypothetical protein